MGCRCCCSVKPSIDIYSEQVAIIYSHSMRSLSLLDCEDVVVATVDSGLERDNLVISIEVDGEEEKWEVIQRRWPAKGTKVWCAAIIKSSDESRKVYCFASVLFLSFFSFLFFDTHAFPLPEGIETPCQKHIAGVVLGWTRRIDSDISPTPSLNFTRHQKVRNLASIFDHSRLSHTHYP